MTPRYHIFGSVLDRIAPIRSAPAVLMPDDMRHLAYQFRRLQYELPLLDMALVTGQVPRLWFPSIGDVFDEFAMDCRQVGQEPATRTCHAGHGSRVRHRGLPVSRPPVPTTAGWDR